MPLLLPSENPEPVLSAKTEPRVRGDKMRQVVEPVVAYPLDFTAPCEVSNLDRVGALRESDTANAKK